MYTRTHFQFAILLVIACVAVFASRQVLLALHSSTTVEYWKDQIRAEGPVRAYNALVDSVHSEDLATQHHAGHVFGAALYEVMGLEALSVCDDRLFYACFHQVIGEVVRDHGISALRQQQIADVCNKKLANIAPCIHSIGHGILATLGYTPEALERSLSICKSIAIADSMNSCASGVFMEYNLHTMLQPDGMQRPLTTTNVYSPCDTLSRPTENEKLWCVFWLPSWWAKNATSSYAQFGSLCEAFDGRTRDACFEGIGRSADFMPGASITLTLSLCSKSTTNEHFRALCLSGAAYALFASGSHEESQHMCGLLVGDSYNLCMQYSEGKRMTPDVAAY